MTASAPLRNRAAVLHGQGDVRVEERPVPIAGAGELQIRVLACGICGSDVHYFREGRIGRYVVDEPMILGHESAGIVLAAGSDSDRWLIGKTVAIEPGVPCGQCEQCIRGRYNLCPDVRFLATPPVDGALSDVIVMPARWVHPAPDGMTAEVAAMAEPLSVGLWAARKANIAVGDRVLVTGAGPVGQLAAQVARARGAHVEIFDVVESRLRVAAGLGIPTADMTDAAYDVLLECSGNQRAVDAGVAALAPAARVVLVGMGAPRVELDLGTLQGRELSVTGTFRYAHTYREALELLHSGVIDVKSLITHRYPLERVADALDAGRSDPNAIKVVVRLDADQ
ncbi:NAD(P)-dependent alcohol dehydrogenase [Microbacterium sp. A204]|uniref:NAD(P)-dependent alcohol dehydrogenase n=1 Tax=Microbacterium sp. A204 TaxID=3457321 RepID=UPI003FD43912